jgi:hypothetical protein
VIRTELKWTREFRNEAIEPIKAFAFAATKLRAFNLSVRVPAT